MTAPFETGMLDVFMYTLMSDAEMACVPGPLRVNSPVNKVPTLNCVELSVGVEVIVGCGSVA